MRTPPLLPEETLHRVLRVANFDGLSVLAVSGMLTLAVASNGNFLGAAVGLLVAAAGALELHGVGLLRAGHGRGIRWLIASQPYLLVVVLAYCALQVGTYDPALLHDAVNRGVGAKVLDDAALRRIYFTSYAVIAVATIIYQGAMTVYYYNRRHAVVAALDLVDEHERFN
jgi:hypothetical protein